MVRILLLGAIFFGGSAIAQKKQKALDSWKNKDAEISQKVFSKYEKKEKSDLIELKKNLAQSQRKIKIEIINKGDWEKYNQTVWFRMVKINDGNLKQVIDTENNDLEVRTNAMGTNNWKDEYGNYSFRSISEPLKISQEFISKKNKKGEMRSPLRASEMYESTEPVFSLSFKIYTHRKDYNAISPADLSKIVNIYADDQLIKTITYSYEDLSKIDGISLSDFKVATIDNR